MFYYHLLLTIAAIIITPAVIAIVVLFIRAPGSFSQRVRSLGGGD